MPTLDAKSLLSDPAPIWFDDAALSAAQSADHDLHDTVPGGLDIDPLQAALAQVEAARQRPALAVVPAPAADPLAMALPWLVRHLGVAAAVEAVVGPVHEDRPVPSDDVLPALRRIGFDAHLQRRSLASLAASDLPTVLLLNSGDACVLTARWQDAQGQAQCSVVLPGPQPDEFSTAEAEIEAEYSGVALLVNAPRPPFASALARARAAAATGGNGAAVAAVKAAPPTADDLVALAAAVQDARRSRQGAATATPPAARAAPSAPATTAPNRAAAVPRWAEPTLCTPPPAAPLDAASDRDAARHAQARWADRRVEPVLGDAPAPASAGAADAEAALLKLSFLQAERSVGVTPGQALQRIGQDAQALVRASARLLGGRLGQAWRGLARLWAAAGLRLGRQGLRAARSVLRASRVAAQGLTRGLRRAGLQWRLRRHALVARVRQAGHRRQARLALADQALALPASTAAARSAPAGQGGSDPWADSLAEAWQQAALDEQVALDDQAAFAPQPGAMVAAACEGLAAAAAPVAQTAVARPIALPGFGRGRVDASGSPMGVADPLLPPAAHPVAGPVRPAQAATLPLARSGAASRWPAALHAPLQAGAGAARSLAGALAGHPWSWMPGLAASSALCLLVGAPQAWAGMVSGSGLQAMWVAPSLLRSAFGADLDQAARRLTEQALERLVAAKERMDCEAGQPGALSAVGAAPAVAPLPAAAVEAASAADGAGAARAALAQIGHAVLSVPALQPAQRAVAAGPTRPAARNRGVPRRARHACR